MVAAPPDAPVAFVTGAGGGLGLELASLLLARGYRVAIFSRSLEALPSRLDAFADSGRVAWHSGDVADERGLRAAVTDTVARWGGIDLAIANAGSRATGRADRLDLEAAKRTLEVNYFGMLHLYAACMPGMVERRRGCFVGIASLAGVRCLPGGAAYGASKAAMQAFLDTARSEVRPYGVSLVVVNPWFIHSAAEPPVRWRPFSTPIERAARRILDGVERGRARIAFPAPVALLWGMVRVLPDAVFDFVFRHRGGRSGLGQRALSLFDRMLRPGRK